MPYIDGPTRAALDSGSNPRTGGELNYVLTKAVVGFVERGGELSYNRLAEAQSALDNASREFYRRVVAPYEDEKCAENGDVYGWLTRER